MMPAPRQHRGKIGVLMRSATERVIALVAPQKINEDDRQIEIVLNAILVSSIALLALLFGTIVYNSMTMDNYNGVAVSTFALIIAFFGGLYALSRKGYIRLASYGIIIVYFIGSFYCGYVWGASLPATLLSFTLVIVMANLLLGMRKGFAVMSMSFVSLIYLTVREMNMPQIIDWKNDPIEVTDIIAYLFIIACMFILSWISRRQTDKSLARARNSERELQIERDSLEIKVLERTAELARVQEERLNELSHIAEFGRLSRGVFHDLLSPLSSMMLQIERMSLIPRDEIRDVRDSLEKISFAGKRFGAYLSSVRSAIGGKKSGNACSFEEELGHAQNLLSFKAREASVSLGLSKQTIGSILFEALPFHQILFNLILNAIDSYDGVNDGRKRRILIDAERNDTTIRIAISDNGVGISPDDLPRIFEPFFTTKKARDGTGIGLATVKRILDGMGGSIFLESKLGQGTTATITIPL